MPAPNEPLATLNGRPILARVVYAKLSSGLRDYAQDEADEMRALRLGEKTPAEVRDALERIGYRRYSDIRLVLENYLMETILDDEAQNRGVTVDGLFAQFDYLREEPVTDAEIDELIRARGVDASKLTKAELESIPLIIRMQRVYEARDEYMKQLRRDANVVILLLPPEIRYAPVEVRRAESTGTGPIIVTVVTDFECPYSKLRVDDMHAWAATNRDVTVTVKHLPLEHIHPFARRAAAASICAAKEDKFWQYHDWLFAQQAELMGEDEEFEAEAARLGLDPTAFHTCLDATDTTAEINADIAWANTVGIRGTPTFFVNGILAREAMDVPRLIEDVRLKTHGGQH